MFADRAEKYDVDIAFLMMQWNCGNTSRNFRRIVEAVGSRRFKALWCPADSYTRQGLIWPLRRQRRARRK